MSALDLWCEHAWLGGPSATAGVVLRIEGERITSVVSGVPEAPAGTAVLAGLTLPGMVNTHVRSSHRVLRGVAAPGLAMMLDRVATPDPDVLLSLARSVYAELALAGYTTVCEFVTRVDSARVDALVQAGRDAGIRLAIADAWTADVAPRDWVQRADTFAETIMRRTDIRLVAGAAELTADAVRVMGEVPVWAAQMGVPLHAAAISVDHTASVLEALSRSGILAHRGGCTLLPPGFSGDDDLSPIGHQRGFVSVDPRLPSSHLLPIGGLRGAGGRMVLGNDVHAPANPFGALRGLRDVAAVQQPAGLSTTELFRMATADAAAALGWRDCGVLASGHLADLMTVSLAAPKFAGIDGRHLHHSDAADLLDGVLAAASPSDITHVAVGGRLIVDRGRHVLGDVRSHLDDAIARAGAPRPAVSAAR